MSEIEVRDVRFTAAPDHLRATGLLGWASCAVNEVLRLQGFAIRRTMNGVLAISFPRKKDEHGVEHRYIEPMTSAVRQTIERRIFESIGLWPVTD